MVTILDPLYYPPEDSNIPTAILRAAPTHLAGLIPYSTGHGSQYKSSRIEFKANSHSLIGTRNLFNAALSPLFNGSLLYIIPSYSLIYFEFISLSPLNTYAFGQSENPSSWT